jgi:hypothetical protein
MDASQRIKKGGMKIGQAGDTLTIGAGTMDCRIDFLEAAGSFWVMRAGE